MIPGQRQAMKGGIEKRADDLESHLAFLEDALENLNQTVARQDREILQLRQQLAHLSAQLKDLGGMQATAGAESGFEVPPHY